MTDYTDPFEDAKPAAQFPSMEQLKGRLVMVKPVKLTENIPSAKYKNPDGTPVLSSRIDAVVTVVDGPVPEFADTEFGPMWISGSYQVTQLTPVLGRNGTILGRVNLKNPKQPKGQGNPWGFEAPTDADKQTARDYIAGKRVAAAEAPAQETNPWAK